MDEGTGRTLHRAAAAGRSGVGSGECRVPAERSVLDRLSELESRQAEFESATQQVIERHRQALRELEAVLGLAGGLEIPGVQR